MCFSPTVYHADHVSVYHADGVSRRSPCITLTMYHDSRRPCNTPTVYLTKHNFELAVGPKFSPSGQTFCLEVPDHQGRAWWPHPFSRQNIYVQIEILAWAPFIGHNFVKYQYFLNKTNTIWFTLLNFMFSNIDNSKYSQISDVQKILKMEKISHSWFSEAQFACLRKTSPLKVKTLLFQ